MPASQQTEWSWSRVMPINQQAVCSRSLATHSHTEWKTLLSFRSTFCQICDADFFDFFYCDTLPSRSIVVYRSLQYMYCTSDTPSPLHVPTDSDKMQKTKEWYRKEYQKALRQTLVTDVE